MSEVAEVAVRIREASDFIDRIRQEVRVVIVGQENLVESLLIGLLADGHVLLEGLPGLAKTLCVEALSRAFGGEFRRIQFTPDLLPSDLVGTQVFNPKSGAWSVKKGPVFANFVLADEINRAPAKVQSALLEAMQERMVTLAGESHPLPQPFLVLATQNPVEQEGTYPLPEAQIDRFMLKVKVSYPSKEDEKSIVRRMATSKRKPQVSVVGSWDDLAQARALLDEIYIDEKLLDYLVNIVLATRDPQEFDMPELKNLILYGASPRASIALAQAGRAQAFLDGRAFVTPQDIKAVGMEVLRHRVITTYEAEAEGLTSEDVINKVFERVRVP